MSRPAPKLRPEYFSYTRLSLWWDCPYAYKLYAIDRIKPDPTYPLLIGRIAHECVAEYDRHLVRENLQTDITVLPEIGRRVYWQQENPGLQGYKDLEGILETVAASHCIQPGLVEGIELKLKLSIMPGVIFTAIVDRLDLTGSRAVIHEYKTDYRVRSQSEVDDDPQLRIYAWAVTQEFPLVEEIECQLHFLRYGTVRTVEIDWHEAQDYGEHIRGTIEQIQKAASFPARPGERCGYCGYAEMCPKRRVKPGPVVCATAEDAQRIAEELAVLERQVADRKEALKAWASTNGPIVANGVRWGYSPTVKKTIDPAGLARVLLQHKQDPWPYLAVDNRKVNRLRKNEELAAALDALTTEEVGTRFGAVKVRGEDNN